MRLLRVMVAAAVALTFSACKATAETSPRRPEFAPVKVGLLITTGGKGGELAGPSLGAAEVAASHLEKDHGVKVTIEQADYQGDLAQVQAHVNDLAGRSDAIVVATDDAAVLPALTALSIPVIHAYITSDGATDPDHIYRVTASDSLQAKALARYLVDHRRYRRIGLLSENTDYGRAGSLVFSDAVGREGATIVAESTFDTGGDIHAAVSSAADAGAQVLVIWTDDPAEAARVVIDVHRSGHSYQLAVAPNSAGPGFGKNAVAQVVPTAFREGILSVGPWVGPWVRSPSVRRFYEDFETTQNNIAPVRTAQVYDAVKLLSAARFAGSIPDGLARTDELQEAGAPISFGQGSGVGAREGVDVSDLWGWGFTKSASGAGAEFFPAVDTGGGFFTLIPAGLEVSDRWRGMLP